MVVKQFDDASPHKCKYTGSELSKVGEPSRSVSQGTVVVSPGSTSKCGDGSCVSLYQYDL